MSPTTRHLWGTDYPIIAKIDDHYDLIAHENGPALAGEDHLCVIDIRTSDEPHLQELKAKSQTAWRKYSWPLLKPNFYPNATAEGCPP